MPSLVLCGVSNRAAAMLKILRKSLNFLSREQESIMTSWVIDQSRVSYYGRKVSKLLRNFEFDWIQSNLSAEACVEPRYGILEWHFNHCTEWKINLSNSDDYSKLIRVSRSQCLGSSHSGDHGEWPGFREVPVLGSLQPSRLLASGMRTYFEIARNHSPIFKA
jgi:hypothetical protein